MIKCTISLTSISKCLCYTEACMKDHGHLKDKVNVTQLIQRLNEKTNCQWIVNISVICMDCMPVTEKYPCFK